MKHLWVFIAFLIGFLSAMALFTDPGGVNAKFAENEKRADGAVDANKKEADFLDWSDVPEEYRFRAFDIDGSLWYYIEKPQTGKATMSWTTAYSKQRGGYLLGGFVYGKNHQKLNWRETLEQRPSPLNTTEHGK